MNLLDLIDVLEERLRARAMPSAACIDATGFRSELSRARISSAELAKVFRIAEESVDDWLAGSRPIPGWVPHSLRIVGLLTPSARRILLNGNHQPARPHPFSRIEEL